MKGDRQHLGWHQIRSIRVQLGCLLAALCSISTPLSAQETRIELDSATVVAISDRIDVIVGSTTAKAGGGASLVAFERLSVELKSELIAIASTLNSGDRSLAREHAGRAKAVLMEMSLLSRDLNVTLTAQEQSFLDRFLRSR